MRNWWRPDVRDLMMLAITTMIPVAVLILLIPGGVEANTVEFEAVKTALQVIGIVVVGAIVGVIAQGIKDRRIHDAAARGYKRNNLRQQYDTMVSIFDRTLVAYNEVKSIRRFLDACTGPKGSRSVEPKVYEKYMRKLNTQQLNFESLKRTAEVWGKFRSMQNSVRECSL